MNLYLDLFLTFAKVGVCTFGGGYAMLPILQREVVEKKGWVTEEEVTDYFAIGQCTPGIIAVNTSVFIGYRQRGVPGGIAAALGVVFPSFVVITIIAAFLTKFATYPVVQHALAGINAAVVALGDPQYASFWEFWCWESCPGCWLWTRPPRWERCWISSPILHSLWWQPERQAGCWAG